MNKRATAVSGSKPSLLPFSPFIHNIKQRIIPKELEQERFEKDVVQWLTILLAYKDDRERDHKRDLEAVMEVCTTYYISRSILSSFGKFRVTYS